MSNRAKRILIFTCVIAALGFIGYQVFRTLRGRSYPPGVTFTEHARLAEFTESGVHVVVHMESDSQGQPLLRATFTPTDQGFHLYSKDLDPNATGGLGRPTRLELLPHIAIRRAGPLFADRTPVNHQGLDIYPDGPITLRLPVQFDSAEPNISAEVAISYMACKTDGICLPPERRILRVQIVSR